MNQQQDLRSQRSKYGRYLTLKECRKEFECNIDCKDCPCLIVQWSNRITRNYSSRIKEVE